MIVNEYGLCGVSQEEVCEALHKNPDLKMINLYLIDDEYNTNIWKMNPDFEESSSFSDLPEIPASDFHTILQDEWIMPEIYKNIDIEEYVYSLCNNENEVYRVEIELELYKKHKLYNLLRYLKYIRDTAIENNIVWGVGRGSSCASYVLYLMKIHRVDCIKYELNINDFLRE